MLIVRGAKGGVGATVVAAGLAVIGGRRAPTVLVDLGGDAAAALGVEPGSTGLSDWAAVPDPAPDGPKRLEREVGDGLSLIDGGPSPETIPADRLAMAGAMWAADGRQFVIDVGHCPHDSIDALLGVASGAVTVTRNCYLSLRRTTAAGIDRVVCVVEPGRALSFGDAERALAPHDLVRVPYSPAVARSVDAGLLRSRLPKQLGALEQLW